MLTLMGRLPMQKKSVFLAVRTRRPRSSTHSVTAWAASTVGAKLSFKLFKTARRNLFWGGEAKYFVQISKHCNAFFHYLLWPSDCFSIRLTGCMLGKSCALMYTWLIDFSNKQKGINCFWRVVHFLQGCLFKEASSWWSVASIFLLLHISKFCISHVSRERQGVRHGDVYSEDTGAVGMIFLSESAPGPVLYSVLCSLPWSLAMKQALWGCRLTAAPQRWLVGTNTSVLTYSTFVSLSWTLASSSTTMRPGSFCFLGIILIEPPCLRGAWQLLMVFRQQNGKKLTTHENCSNGAIRTTACWALVLPSLFHMFPGSHCTEPSWITCWLPDVHCISSAARTSLQLALEALSGCHLVGDSWYGGIGPIYLIQLPCLTLLFYNLHPQWSLTHLLVLWSRNIWEPSGVMH